MPFEGDSGGEGVPQRHKIPHYHGDIVRALFFAGAIILIVAQSTGADLRLSTVGAVFLAIALVVVAGVTNPNKSGIHWLNACIAVIGTIFFGTAAIEHYRADTNISIFDPSFAYIEALTLLSLVALYFTTRTIRGFRLRLDNS
jgi:hypothetical protein